MLYHLAQDYLKPLWGPLRLLASHLVLIGIGLVGSSILVGVLIQKYKGLLPTDRGRVNTPKAEAEKSKGKPTGAGIIMVSVLIVLMLIVVPMHKRLLSFIFFIGLTMLSGYFDDAGKASWGEWKKGLLDLMIVAPAALCLTGLRPVPLWLPFFSETFMCPVWAYTVMGTCVLWGAINTTNCSDGVDGLAGTLCMISFMALAAFLYVIVGHKEVADYLLIPWNPGGARWAILLFTCVGGLGGYLWHNAEPSSVMMGDAGSRALGFIVGGAVLATGNPFIILVTAPMILVNGGSGLLKLIILRLCRKLGLATEKDTAKMPIVLLHRVRFPLHDHCRKNLGWKNSQVLMRFALMHGLMLLVLLGMMMKLR